MIADMRGKCEYKKKLAVLIYELKSTHKNAEWYYITQFLQYIKL